MLFSDSHILITGFIVFFARILDVSIGTVRTIVTVQGRAVAAFFLAVLEILIWISVAGTVISQIHDRPELAVGLVIFKVITSSSGLGIADAIRKKGQPVTVFRGEGMNGPVSELYMACKRKCLKWILPLVTRMDPKAFYIIEQARDMRKGMIPLTAALKWTGKDK